MDQYLQQYADLYAELNVPGVDPDWALIIEDCRDEDAVAAVGDMSGKLAINLGDFYMPDVLRKSYGEPDDMERLHDALVVQPDEYEADSEFDLAFPLLLTEDGDLIWGAECYWGSVGEEGDALLSQFGISIEQLSSRFSENRILDKFSNFLRRRAGPSEADASCPESTS